MTLPGLLIEYLISGTIALIWLVPLLASFNIHAMESIPLPLMAVALYIVGMTIDFLAYWMVRPLKGVLRRKAWRKYGEGGEAPNSSVDREIQFSLYAPELAKEVAMRSSRDRIARGAVANAAIAFLIEHVLNTYPPTLGIVAWIVIILLLLAMWSVFQSLSFRYEIRADRALREKIASNTLVT